MKKTYIRILVFLLPILALLLFQVVDYGNDVDREELRVTGIEKVKSLMACVFYSDLYSESIVSKDNKLFQAALKTFGPVPAPASGDLATRTCNWFKTTDALLDFSKECNLITEEEYQRLKTTNAKTPLTWVSVNNKCVPVFNDTSKVTP